MFYWIYTKKNETKPIISRNFATSVEGVKFATRNGSEWSRGEMMKKGERYGEYLNGKIRVGSKIESSVKPKVKAVRKRVATNCDVIVSNTFELHKVLYSLDSTNAKWKTNAWKTNAKPSDVIPHFSKFDVFPMVIHVRSNRISWEPCINAVDINKKIK